MLGNQGSMQEDDSRFCTVEVAHLDALASPIRCQYRETCLKKCTVPIVLRAEAEPPRRQSSPGRVGHCSLLAAGIRQIASLSFPLVFFQG
jgi:hypothetical protein